MGYNEKNFKDTIPFPAEYNPNLRYKVFQRSRMTNIMAVSLGPVVKGLSMPIADSNSVYNFEAGLRKRVGRVVPQIRPNLLPLLRSHVRLWLKKNLTPIPALDELYTDNDKQRLERWLAGEQNYNEARKQQLRDAYEMPIRSKHMKIKSHIKVEFMSDIKAARLINSRLDAVKAFLGPFFHKVESILFSTVDRRMGHCPFVKYIPVSKRMECIHEHLGKGRFIVGN